MKFRNMIALLIVGFLTMGFPMFGKSDKSDNKKSDSRSATQSEKKVSSRDTAPQSSKSSFVDKKRGSSDKSEDDAEGGGGGGANVPTIPDAAHLDFSKGDEAEKIRKTQQLLVDVPNIPESNLPGDGLKLPGDPSSVSPEKVGADLVNVQRQIDSVIRINEGLKTKYQAQANDIQKISDQAKAHQRILVLQDLSRPSSAKTGVTDHSAIMQRENIDKIQSASNGSVDSYRRAAVIGQRSAKNTST